MAATAQVPLEDVALLGDGTVWSWGVNDVGPLGTGTVASDSTPTTLPARVTGLSGVTSVAAGLDHALALTADGGVWAWGNNLYGMLGDGTDTTSPVPVRVQGLSSVVAVGAGQ